jgi:hypothetical protein
MTARYDFFVKETGAENAYLRIGYDRNPFRPVADDAARQPLYTGHIKEQLQQIQQWAREVNEKRVRQPLSIVGSLGTGKTTILRVLEVGLSAWPSTEKVFVHSVLLSDTGYARVSVGAMLISALERAMESIADDVPSEVLAIVWAVIQADDVPGLTTGPLGMAIKKARDANGEQQRALAVDISQWLRRLPLTPTRVRESGLARPIDWEGELVGVVAELLTLAQQTGALKTFFLFVDQIEELFRPTFSELRRARILTDLRSLVDSIDDGAPIGLLLAWAPESDESLQKKYEALYARLQRRRIDLPLLTEKDAEPFAKVWVDALPGQEPKRRRPKLDELVKGAWSRLYQQRQLMPSAQERTEPRTLLKALAEEVDERAGVRSPAGGGSAH